MTDITDRFNTLSPNVEETNTIKSLRETLAEIEKENRLLEQAVSANNQLILYLFRKEKK